MDYKEMNAIGIVRLMLTDGVITEEIAGKYFPELKESEDERIRKDIIWCFKHSGLKESNPINPHVITTTKDAVAWLEKQGKKKSVDDLTQQEAMDIAVAKCFEQGEQKPIIVPKFSVGDTIQMINANQFKSTIKKIKKGGYLCNNDFITFDQEHKWELVEQKPAWSEEDERMWLSAIEYIRTYPAHTNSVVDWLKSLKDRYTWKPSDEQIKALERECMAHSNYDLCRLCEQLKKLREE